MKKQFLNYAIISTLLISFNVTLQAESNLTFKGDIRLRSQYETQGENTRLRERIRFRLGASKELSEQTTVTFGLATGSSDARSTNQTFDNSFETPDIRFDYAYIDQKLSNQLSLRAGKMKNPIWKPSDLLWDSDINPNGVSFQYKKENYNITSALLILEENDNNTIKDPIMVVIQPQLKWNLTPAIQIKNAIGLYLTQHVKGVSLNHTAETNTGATTALPNEFAPIVLSAQADLTDQLGLELLRPFVVFDYYMMDVIDGTSNSQSLAQLDFNVKF